MSEAHTDRSTGDATARVLTVLGFVFGAIAVLILPILFGPAGIVCAAVALKRGDPLARWSLGVAIVGMLAGFALGAVLMTAETGG